MSISKELESLDALSQADLVQRKEVKPGELVEAAIGRIERINSKLNAFIHTVYDQAFRAAGAWEAEIMAGRAGDVPFCGVPFLLKDLLAECKDTLFSEGSKAVKGYVSKLDSEIVKRQKAGGLIVLGKTNTCEFGLLPTTEPALFWRDAEPLEYRLDRRRLQWRFRGRGGQRNVANGPWQRWRWVLAHSSLLLRHIRP